MKYTISKILAGFTALSLILIAGCSLNSDSGVGTLQVKLHDNAADYQEVNVFVERVEVNNSSGDEGWQVINEPNESYDLLQLINGQFEIIADAELEAGTYEQIRLILSRDNNSVKMDDVMYDLTIPSGSETGIKLNINAEIEEGIQYVLLLDFDVEKSVVQTGMAQSPGFILQPVIRATPEAITGNIGGVISPAGVRTSVSAIEPATGESITTTVADEETGEFLLVGLEEGTYNVTAEASETGYETITQEDVTVTVGDTNEIGELDISSTQ